MEIQLCPYLYLTFRLWLYIEEWREANNYNLPCAEGGRKIHIFDYVHDKTPIYRIDRVKKKKLIVCFFWHRL